MRCPVTGNDVCRGPECDRVGNCFLRSQGHPDEPYPGSSYGNAIDPMPQPRADRLAEVLFSPPRGVRTTALVLALIGAFGLGVIVGGVAATRHAVQQELIHGTH